MPSFHAAGPPYLHPVLMNDHILCLLFSTQLVEGVHDRALHNIIVALVISVELDHGAFALQMPNTTEAYAQAHMD